MMAKRGFLFFLLILLWFIFISGCSNLKGSENSANETSIIAGTTTQLSSSNTTGDNHSLCVGSYPEYNIVGISNISFKHYPYFANSNEGLEVPGYIFYLLQNKSDEENFLIIIKQMGYCSVDSVNLTFWDSSDYGSYAQGIRVKLPGDGENFKLNKNGWGEMPIKCYSKEFSIKKNVIPSPIDIEYISNCYSVEFCGNVVNAYKINNQQAKGHIKIFYNESFQIIEYDDSGLKEPYDLGRPYCQY